MMRFFKMKDVLYSPPSVLNKGGSIDPVASDTVKKLVTVPRPVATDEPNSKVDLPVCSVVLPPRDDAAEYDDTGDTHNFQDDPKIVVWRKGNKAAVKFVITPRADLSPGDKVIFSFGLEYGYVNTMPTTVEQKQPQRAEMQVNVLIVPGSIIGVPGN